MNRWLNFDGDPDHRLDTGIVFRIRQYWEIRKVVNEHKPAAHTDSPDVGTGKTWLGGGMHCPSAFSIYTWSTIWLLAGRGSAYPTGCVPVNATLLAYIMAKRLNGRSCFWCENFHRGQLFCIGWDYESAHHGKADLPRGGVMNLENYGMSLPHNLSSCSALHNIVRDLKFAHDWS